LEGHRGLEVDTTVGGLEVDLGHEDGLGRVTGAEGEDDVDKSEEGVAVTTGGKKMEKGAVVDGPPRAWDDVEGLVMGESYFGHYLALFVDS
jgi:hypothetical protein